MPKKGIRIVHSGLHVRASTVLDVVTQSVAVPMLHASTVLVAAQHGLVASGVTGKITVIPGTYLVQYRARFSGTGTFRAAIGKGAAADSAIGTALADGVDELATSGVLQGMAIVECFAATFFQLLFSNETGTGDCTLTKADFLVTDLENRSQREAE